MNYILLWVCLGVVFLAVIVFVAWLCYMASQKRREEAEEELASRNSRAAQQTNQPDESLKNPVHVDDSNLPPLSNFTAFREPLPPPPSYEEVVRASTEQLP